MKIFREIFGRIWAVWAVLIFVSTMILFLFPFLLFSYFKREPIKTYRFISLSRIWMDVFLTIAGFPLRVTGREYFAPGENYIVLCNHNSFMDVPVSSPAIPGGNKTIAKIEMAKTPIFGLMYRTGSILVDRKSDSSRKDSFNKMKQVLAMGLHMCIYPEGTRNKSQEPLKPFHNGAFKLAVDTRKSIVPALIFNTRKALPADKFFYSMPTRLYMDFLPPVHVLPNDTADSLRERVHEIMKAYYLQHSK
ncbi:MAG: lysophospholipid acyltransferase family protein [Flavitalea sp.]